MAAWFKNLQLDAKVKSLLYENVDEVFWKRWLAAIEAKANVKREYIFYGVVSLFSIYLVVGHFAALACNLTAFLYPAYASMKALQTTGKDDDTHWLMYWTVFGVFSIIDFASERIVGWFPIYWLVKCLFLVWLYMPMTRGAERVWLNWLQPLFLKYGYLADKIGETASNAAGSAAIGMMSGQTQGSHVPKSESPTSGHHATEPEPRGQAPEPPAGGQAEPQSMGSMDTDQAEAV